MLFDDHELGADAGAWGGLGGDGKSSAPSSNVPRIKPMRLTASWMEQPHPDSVPITEPYDINCLGERPPLPPGFVAPVRKTLNAEVPANFNPYGIWDPKIK